MGKISKVFYEELNNSINEAAEYYYFYNLLSSNNKIVDSEYEQYEENQINIKNKIIGKAFNSGNIPRHPKVNYVILGISPIKRKSIIISEY